MSEDRPSGQVQSVVRAASLLARFADAESGLTLTELARSTGLTVSTAHRLLGTLCATGLLCRDADRDRFLPGPLLLRLSRSSLLADDLSDISAHLEALVEETRETACFAMRRGDEVTVLLAVRSREALRVDVNAGERAPLVSSAIGHALLAFGDEPVDDAVAALQDAPDDLRVDVLAAQFRGFAVRDGGGIRSIAAPIRAGGALELRGPRERMLDADRLGRILQRHTAAVARLPTAAAL
jgi:IclR family acetate operon transcriptional repressor